MVKKKKKAAPRRRTTRKKRGMAGIPGELLETGFGVVIGAAAGKFAELEMDKRSTSGPINPYLVALVKAGVGGALAAFSKNAVVKGIGYGLIGDGTIDGVQAAGGFKSFGIPAYVKPGTAPAKPTVTGTPGMRRLAGTPGMRILNGANPSQGGIMGAQDVYPHQGGLMGVEDNSMQQFDLVQSDDWSLEGNY